MIFKLTKGEHYSDNWVYKIVNLLRTNNDSCYAVTFDETCMVYSDDSVNKLLGVSFGHHHKNSIRFGWNYKQGSKFIDIYAYVYNKGVRTIDWIAEISPNKSYYFRVVITGDNCLLTIGNSVYEASRYYDINTRSLRYNLYPYFGGKLPCPEDMYIEIERL